MISPRGGRVVQITLTSSSAFYIPTFLAPALNTPTRSKRYFSSTPKAPSKLGRVPVSIPPGVEVNLGAPRVKPDPTTYLQIARSTATVKGPLGTVELEIPEYVNADYDAEGKKVAFTIKNKNVKQQKAMWGTTWAYFKNAVTGVSEGHTAILRLVGVGFRATVENRKNKEEYEDQKFVCLKLGFTHPVELGVPKGVTASVPQPTRILLEGCNREEVMQFAAKIRWWRRPEPYKGKGIFVNDETIKLKQKKIK
ncbi:hypothetical protein MKZ38_007175 [Zalerion maritima]|uniref:Large ribosomal subunit protein uL6 alpha-beta domain-containing protein n=1 Tax=Zalerion maritima TaxID=339359 RepID=A0AAD5RJA7_9PEZI|nr:hypothetical protein MKZ38_007175 [Zalerion maritima]